MIVLLATGFGLLSVIAFTFAAVMGTITTRTIVSHGFDLETVFPIGLTLMIAFVACLGAGACLHLSGIIQ
jgi:hypothetical protein